MSEKVSRREFLRGVFSRKAREGLTRETPPERPQFFTEDDAVAELLGGAPDPGPALKNSRRVESPAPSWRPETVSDPFADKPPASWRPETVSDPFADKPPASWRPETVSDPFADEPPASWRPETVSNPFADDSKPPADDPELSALRGEKTDRKIEGP